MATRDITARLNFHKGLLARAAAFAIVAAALCGALALGSVLRNPSRVALQPGDGIGEGGRKDQTRVGTEGRSSERQIPSTIAKVSIWHPGKMESAPAEGPEGLAPAPSNAEDAGEWREQNFSIVSVVDARTFTSGELTIRLAGVEVPAPDQVCRTLDNRLEQCAIRAATQLELLTRSRTLACRYRMTTSSEAIGSCRIGSHDLAERLARTGFVRTADAGRTVMANAGQTRSR
jgi:endonuclease YncB( thermonuclease family)